jgi:protein gp37
LNRTKIEYLDYTWNPIVGCSGVGCAVAGVCWAKGQGKRQKPRVDRNGKKRGCQDCYDFKPHYHYERFRQPLAVKKPSRVGVGFMGDLFDSAFNITVHQQLFGVMAQASWHTFLVLTKQSKNMLTFVDDWMSPPANAWLGVSVNRKQDLYRIDNLLATEAEVKFVSFEPLYEDLGPVDLSGIDWVIIGAQRRPTIQPEKNWVANLIMKGMDAGAAIFLKNNLACINEFSRRLQEIPEVEE